MRARRVLFSALVLLSASPLLSEGVLHAQTAGADPVATLRHGVFGDARLERPLHIPVCDGSTGALVTTRASHAAATGTTPRGPSSLCPDLHRGAPAEQRVAVWESGPEPAQSRPAPSLRRDVLWGGAIGASMGLLSGLLVSAACGSVCDGTGAAGVALHVGTGTVVGAAAGAVVHWVRR